MSRLEWRRTRARLQRLATPPRSRAAQTDDAALDDREIDTASASGAATLATTHPVGPALKWVGWICLALAALIILLMAIWDWDWFRGPIARYASMRTHRAVRIDGHLKVHLLTWTPQVWISGLKIGNPAWAGPGDVAQIPSLTVRAKLLPLLAGRMELPLVEADRPDLKLYSDAQGRANWKGDPNDETAAKFPPIQHLIIRDGHVALQDVKRRLRLVGTVNTSENDPGSGRGIFRLQGQGTLNSHPFLLRVTGAPLIDVRKDRPYRFDADLRAGDTHLAATGQIDRPFDFAAYEARLTASGDDLADLYDITGVAFPTTPTYSTTGVFSRADGAYRYRRFSGRVGSSDLAGDLTISKRKGRRVLTADLVSRSLDWKDLAAVIGGAPVASKGASPKLNAVAAKLKAEGRILPDSPMDVSRLRSMDADVKFRATAVQANAVKLARVRLGVKLNQGVMVVDPLSFDFAQGTLNGRARTDARPEVPVTDIDLRLSNYALQSFLPQRGGAAPASGFVDAQAHLHGAGRSVHQTMANADGRVRFVVPHGEIRQAFAELLGINVGKGLSLLLGKDQHKTELRCAAADFDVSRGTMRARDITIDTGVVVSRGSGVVDLDRETMNFRLEGKSKRPRLLRLWAPILIHGQLRHPQVGVDKRAVVAQGGVAVAVGALIGPLATVLPFLTPGGAKDVDCAALVAGRAPTVATR